MVTAAITATSFESLLLPTGWKHSDFRDVTVENINYKVVYSFDSYFTDPVFRSKFDFVFDNEDNFQTWERTGQYSYFIIPLDIVSQIKHYSAWIKEAYPEKIFDVVLNTEEIEVEGQMIQVPTNIIKMIPCGITAFNAEGEMLLDAVIESWNTQVPSKAIDFNVKFYSLSELTQFIESCTNSR